MKSPLRAASGLHVRYEKAGLIFDALPVPWNADAVIIEANVRLPKATPRDKRDFTLRWTDGESICAELLVEATKATPMRVFFRDRVPTRTQSASVFWRDRALGEIDVPVMDAAEYLQGFAIEQPTLHVTLGAETAACTAFVQTQAKSILASAVFAAPGPLAATCDLDLRVEVESSLRLQLGSTRIVLAGESLRARQALATVALPRLRWIDAYRVSWHLGSRCLASQSLRSISKKTFQQSLRISTTRFVLHKEDGAMQTVRSLPMRDDRLSLDGVREVAPCYFVRSGEPGVAGRASFTLSAAIGAMPTTLASEAGVLVTSSPTPIVLGAMPVRELERVAHFTLAAGDRVLGNLTLLPAPSASFDAEGGFAGLDDFLWSPIAEEQLNERLGKLLGDG